MTNSMPQSSLDITRTTAHDGGGASCVQEQRVSKRQQQQQQSNDQRDDVCCLSRLNLQENEDEKDMASSIRRIQWQAQQEHRPEFAAPWITAAPAQPTEGLQYHHDLTNSGAIRLRMSSFHYNLHAKLHVLFKDD